MSKRNQLRLHRKRRVRVKGTATRPRINVYKSLRQLYIQLIDDQAGVTLVSVRTAEVDAKHFNIEIAKKAGLLLAKKAKDKKIEEAVFDRGGYKYHGKVKAVADGAREGGLKF